MKLFRFKNTTPSSYARTPPAPVPSQVTPDQPARGHARRSQTRTFVHQRANVMARLGVAGSISNARIADAGGPALSWLDPDTAFSLEQPKKFDDFLEGALNLTAITWGQSSQKAWKPRSAGKQDNDHVVPAAKHLVMSLAAEMPDEKLAGLEDRNAVSAALLAHAGDCLAGKMDQQQIEALQTAPGGPMRLIGLAVLLSGPLKDDYGFLVTNADRINHVRMAYLSHMDLPARMSASETMKLQELLEMATHRSFLENMEIVTSLSQPEYGFELGRLVREVKDHGPGRLRAVQEHFELLKKHLLDAGYRDLPQRPRTGPARKLDRCLRTRILTLASYGEQMISSFVKNYPILRSYQFDGEAIVRIASTVRGNQALISLVEKFPELKSIMEANGVWSDDAKKAITLAAQCGGASSIQTLLEEFTVLMQAPYRFLPEEILAMAGRIGGGTTLKKLVRSGDPADDGTPQASGDASLFEQLRAGLERENYSSRTEDGIPAGSKGAIQEIVSAVASRDRASGELHALRDYLAAESGDRPFSTETAINLLRSRGGANAFLSVKRYASVLRQQPYCVSETDILAIANAAPGETLALLTDGGAYQEIQGLLTGAGYTADDASRAIVRIATQSGACPALEATRAALRELTVHPYGLCAKEVVSIAGIHGAAACFTALRKHYLTLRAEPYRLSHAQILAIVTRSGGGGRLDYLVDNFKEYTAGSLELAPEDMVRILAYKGGIPALEALSHLFARLTTQPYSLRPADVVRITKYLGGSTALFAVADMHGTLTADPFNLETAQVVRVAANDSGGDALHALKDHFPVLASAPFNLKSNEIVRIAARTGGAAALLALVELHPILTRPPYSMPSRGLARIAMVNGAAKKLLAFVEGDSSPDVRAAAARVGAVFKKQFPRVQAEDDAEQIEQQAIETTVDDEGDTQMQEAEPPAPTMSAAGLKRDRNAGQDVGPEKRQRITRLQAARNLAASGSAVSPAQLRQLAVRAESRPVEPVPAPVAVETDGRFQKVLQDVQNYRPELNTRFFARDIRNPEFVDRRFALPGNPTQVDPQWEMTELVAHPEYGLANMLASLPVLDGGDKLFNKYRTYQAQKNCMAKILREVKQELDATRENQASVANGYYTVDRLKESDIPSDPAKLLGRVGDWGVFANMERLLKSRKDFVVLGIYAGAGIRDKKESEIYHEAIGLGDARAKAAAEEGSEAYEHYMDESGLREDRGRFLVHGYEMSLPTAPGSGIEEVAYQGAIDGNAMARINTSVTTDPHDPESLIFDEEGLNTAMLPLLSSWKHKGTGNLIEGEPLMAIVASASHVRHHLREHGLPRVQFMLDYGEDHVEAHMKSYRAQ